MDGEYQNEFQVVDRIKNGVLHLKLEHLSFSDIADDKRNAHKVIAATLQLEIPQEVCRRKDGHLWADLAGGGRGPEIPGDAYSL